MCVCADEKECEREQEVGQDEKKGLRKERGEIDLSPIDDGDLASEMWDTDLFTAPGQLEKFFPVFS